MRWLRADVSGVQTYLEVATHSAGVAEGKGGGGRSSYVNGSEFSLKHKMATPL